MVYIRQYYGSDGARVYQDVVRACHLPLRLLEPHEICPQCSLPARLHREHYAFEKHESENISTEQG